jgi:hypothetical protein
MNVTDWFAEKLVKPIVAGVTEGVLQGITAEADRTIAEVSANLENVGDNITGNVNSMETNLTNSLNGMATNLVTQFKTLIPHIPGLG